MKPIDKVIQFALGEVGYKESPINITKYNDWADSEGIWFTKVQGCSWCTTFIWYCIEKALSWKEYEFDLEDFCVDSNCCWSDSWMNNFKYAGRFYTVDPQVGDLAFMKGHVGLVVATKQGYIETVEGNVADSVQLKKRPYDTWLGFGRPAWERVMEETIIDSETQDALMWCINQGVYIGREDGEMHWKDNLTREEMAIILYRYWRKFNR